MYLIIIFLFNNESKFVLWAATHKLSAFENSQPESFFENLRVILGIWRVILRKRRVFFEKWRVILRKWRVFFEKWRVFFEKWRVFLGKLRVILKNLKLNFWLKNDHNY